MLWKDPDILGNRQYCIVILRYNKVQQSNTKTNNHRMNKMINLAAASHKQISYPLRDARNFLNKLIVTR